jgi:DNA-binding HxlR family transcriptional regulator
MKNQTNGETAKVLRRNPNPIDIGQFQTAINAVVGKWKIEILCALMGGPRRFGELRRDLSGVTQHMLTAQLRDLERCGLVLRTAYAEIPPRVEYELTEPAYALRPVCDALLEWSRHYADQLDLCEHCPTVAGG